MHHSSDLACSTARPHRVLMRTEPPPAMPALTADHRFGHRLSEALAGARTRRHLGELERPNFSRVDTHFRNYHDGR